MQPIYFRNPVDMASTAAFIHEISGGRFWLGIGVTHGPGTRAPRHHAGQGRSLTFREYIAAMEAASAQHGDLPPIVLATLRQRMAELSAEISSGAVWANASCNDFQNSVAHLGDAASRDDFFVGNMIPTVIDDDRAAGAARNRKTLAGYVSLPNYRNYWKQAGWIDEMEAAETAIAAGDTDALNRAMTDELAVERDAVRLGQPGP